MQIEFSRLAIATLSENISFLEVVWTRREVVIFMKDVKKIIDELEKGNYRQFQKSFNNTYSALIGKKHVRMFFRKENDNLIKVLLFFDVRQNPEKIIELLK